MKKYKDILPYMLIAVSGLLEWVIVTHIHNANRLPDTESGVWAFRGLDGTWLSIFSWTVVVFVAVAFVLLFVSVQLGSMLGVIALSVLVELTWGRELPSPQDRWDYGLVFLAGALAMFIAALREANFIGDAKTRLQAAWGR